MFTQLSMEYDHPLNLVADAEIQLNGIIAMFMVSKPSLVPRPYRVLLFSVHLKNRKGLVDFVM